MAQDRDQQRPNRDQRDAVDDYAVRLIAAARPQPGDGRTPFASAAYRMWIVKAGAPTRH